MSESQDSDESDSKSGVFEVKTKPQKPQQFSPNVMQFKPHFIPGTAFHPKTKDNQNIGFVRKRNKTLKPRDSQQLVESIDGNDSDETIIDDDYTEEDWRNGPAKYWYDLIDLPEDCLHYDYGLKLRPNCPSNNSKPNNSCIDSEDAFNLVSQTNWEMDVIWDPDVVRQQVLKNAEKPSIAGWLPIDDNRRAPEFVRQLDNNCIQNSISDNYVNNENNNKVINSVKNSDKNEIKTKIKSLNGFSRNLRKRKANKVCDMSIEMCNKVPKIEVSPQWVTTLPEENRELAINRWEDEIIWDTEAMDKLLEPKIIPFNGDDDNVIIHLENYFDDNSNDSTAQLAKHSKDLSLNYNISNDEFYASVIKADNSSTHGIIITHSSPALRLDSLCFSTYVHDFERPLLKRSKFLVTKDGNKVMNCVKKIKLNGNLFESQNSVKDLSKYRINCIKDLTAREGDIILMEYSEEDPPLIMRRGMGSKLINYFKKTKDKTSSPKAHKYADTKCVTDSPFIGDIRPGESQLALETNMFRSPIFEHNCPETDFLIIISNKSIYIRVLDGLFVVGQQLPLMEVPRPKSKYYFDFVKQFAKMFVYRYFDGRKSVKDLDINLKKAFPKLSQHFLTQFLRSLTRKESDRFVLQSNIPFEEQINTLLTPEDCCAYYSTTIAEHKLRERGFGDRLYLVSESKDCDNKLDELAIAPWNTSVSYIGSLNNKKWLNLSDINSDGSIVFTNQSYKEFKDRMPTIKRCQPVSNLSLQRMTLKRGQEWLINYGLSRDKVRKIKNMYECRDLVKHLSEKLRQSGVTLGMNKSQTTEQHYRYECQKLFDLHTSYYSSQENYSTDEEEDEEEEEEESDSDLEDMGQVLEALILGNKTMEEIENEREEELRKEWMNSMKGIKDPKPKTDEKKRSFKGQVLKITRVYERNGKRFTNTETVRNHKVIEPYVRIRETKTEEFIRQLSFVRNIAENGKGLTKLKTKQKLNPVVNKESTKQLNGISKTITEKVSAFTENSNEFNGINIDDDDWEITETIDSTPVETEALVSVDGSKLKFSKKVVEVANDLEAEEQKRLREEEEEEMRWKRVDYTTPRNTRRCRIDPMVKLIDIFDDIILKTRKLEELQECIEFFNNPVKEKEYPDYYHIIKNPIDLKTIRLKAKGGKYVDRHQFIKDIELIYENSLEYSGEDNEVTKDSKKLLKYCNDMLKEREEELDALENMLSNDSFFQTNRKQLYL